MQKNLLLTFLLALISTLGFSQADRFWSANTESRANIVPDKGVARLAYPKVFKLFKLNIEPLRNELFTIVDNSTKRSTIITLPNADGGMEKFEVWEASNFVPSLQAQFPGIRAFSGRGITDRYATLKLSISPQGISTMVFRVEKENEFSEPYSNDHTVYSVYKSQREKGRIPWVCSTVDTQLATGLNSKVLNSNNPSNSDGILRTARLAQSVNGEYSNYFGAFNSGQSALVYAAINTTLTRCNGCYEKDLALHLNLISNFYEDQIIFYDPTTDPYTSLPNWNAQLQNLLNNVVGDANYDIGHMFGASGGGGNAGCIGCICVAGQKGSGITSPADNIPMGDNFDIDYVVHEVGHQLGGNHSFTFSNEGTQAQKEIGAGITIMGYAGITSYDPAPHSIDIYHEANIAQIQTNLASKACPTTLTMTANHPPVVAPVSNYTIPMQTPFALTGSATDQEGDPITYCWEQNDVHGGQTAANSVAYAAKPVGPNFLSFSPTVSPTRIFPRLSTILAGLQITPPLPGGDAICNIEALSTVSRTETFRLTVRDNNPYVPGLKIGQTSFTDMTLTITNSSGPFNITAPNTNVSWNSASTQTVTWNVNNTTAAPVSCANVKITLSTDGGQTFPTVLAASVPNNGSATITVPNTPTTTARIKVEAVGNIFFDIDDANFTIVSASPTFTFTAPSNASVACGTASAPITLQTNSVNGFNTPITLVASGNPAGTTVTYSVNPVNPGQSTVVTLNNMSILSPGTYPVTITGTAGAETSTVTLNYIVNAGAGPAITAQPSASAICAGSNTSFSVTSAGATSFQWQVSTDGGATWNNITNNATYGGATTNTLSLTGVTAGMNGYLYRAIASVQCGSTNSSSAALTVQSAPAITSQPTASTVCGSTTTSFSVTASGAGLTYQWQVSTDNCATWNNVNNVVPYSGATTATLTITSTSAAMSGYAYRVVVGGTCSPAATSSSCIKLTVNTPITVTAQPANSTTCAGFNASFAATASGTGPSYQWQVSTDGGATWNNVTNGGVYSNATTATLNITGATAGMTGYQYRVVVNGTAPCGSVNSNAGTLTVQTAPLVTSSPSNNTLCVGSSNTFTVVASGSNLTYQWQVSTDAGATFTNLANGGPYSGVNTSSLTVNPLTAAMNSYQYKVVVSGSCTPSVTSGTATLTVITPVSITSQPNAVTAICSTGNTQFTVTGSSTVPISYQWQVSSDGGATWSNVVNAAPYSGATTATLTITNVPTTLSGNRYRVLLSNATCTSPTISNQSLLTVNVLPTATVATSATSILAGNVAILTATTTPTAGLNIQWQRSTDGGLTWTDVPGATGNTYTVDVNYLGDYRVRVVDVATGTCVNYSTKVNVAALPSDNLFIYPSPTPNGIFTVTYYNGGASTIEGITVYDGQGRRVYNSTFPVSQAYQLTKVDLGRNSSGIYIVVLRDANGKRIKTGKVLVR